MSNANFQNVLNFLISLLVLPMIPSRRIIVLSMIRYHHREPWSRSL